MGSLVLGVTWPFIGITTLLVTSHHFKVVKSSKSVQILKGKKDGFEFVLVN